MSDVRAEPLGGGWRRVTSTVVGQSPRRGWPGAWDAIVSAVTRRPSPLVEATLEFSVFVKTPDEATFDVRVESATAEWGLSPASRAR